MGAHINIIIILIRAHNINIGCVRKKITFKEKSLWVNYSKGLFVFYSALF